MFSYFSGGLCKSWLFISHVEGSPWCQGTENVGNYREEGSRQKIIARGRKGKGEGRGSVGREVRGETKELIFGKTGHSE